jgi:hypothetical protein
MVQYNRLSLKYISGENKYEMTLQPMCLDDYVGKDNICRAIEAYAILKNWSDPIYQNCGLISLASSSQWNIRIPLPVMDVQSTRNT